MVKEILRYAQNDVTRQPDNAKQTTTITIGTITTNRTEILRLTQNDVTRQREADNN